MARPKKTIKAKEPVRLRSRKLANGNSTLYLDIYVEGHRSYEYLKMYLVPDNAPGAKIANENTLRAANAIKAKRIVELTNGKAGIKIHPVSTMQLGEFISAYIEKYKSIRSASTIDRATQLLKRLKEWGMDSVRLKDVDVSYCRKFIKRINDCEDFNGSSKHIRYCTLVTIMIEAVRKGMIESNPFDKLDADEKIRRPFVERDYLTIEELKQLIDSPLGKYKRPTKGQKTVRQAFIFDCFCGLRISDLVSLKWSDIHECDGYKELRITMTKTKKFINIPLSEIALRWLPARTSEDKDSLIFPTMPASHKDIMRQWGIQSGIGKHITFHTARHTFATLLLTQGADLYAVCKLLGHSDIKTTQIYAKLIDAKKVEAVNLLNGII